jgi:hypothetical protein
LKASGGARRANGRVAPEATSCVHKGWEVEPEGPHSVMIPPQVHLRSGFKLLSFLHVLIYNVSKVARLYLKQDKVPPTST